MDTAAARSVLILLTIGAGACSGSSASSASSGDPGFSVAPHPSFARGNIPNRGGPILAHMKLVTVTFPGYELESAVERFGAWLPTSSWLTTVGAEYGIGAGTSAGHTVLPDAAPGSITLTQLGALLAARVRDGTLPSDPDRGLEADHVYAVFLPRTTTVHILPDDAGCTAAAGFHASYSDGELLFAFSATPGNCDAATTELGLDEEGFVELDASHEILEAASDPYFVATNGSSIATGPAAWELDDVQNPWLGIGGEIGDGCALRAVRADGFTVQRAWSNAAASAGRDPCVPAVEPLFGVSASSDDRIVVGPGATARVPIVGWSDAPIAAWNVGADAAAFITSSFVPTASVTPMQLANGGTGTLEVRAPAGTPSGSRGYVFLTSKPAASDGPLAFASWQVWPVLVSVE